MSPLHSFFLTFAPPVAMAPICVRSLPPYVREICPYVCAQISRRCLGVSSSFPFILLRSTDRLPTKNSNSRLNKKPEKGLRAIVDGLSASTRADHKSQNSPGR